MSKVNELLGKGVAIPCPESVLIGDEVDVSRISGEDVVIYPGCRIFGASTLILQGARLGREAPATVENCQVGPGVRLKGGFFKGAVFLKNASMGSGAHVREGTILEEEASGAHTVGLKQTILFPFVTLGSLINFCDCFMSGGTSRKDHSEVGSSFIHFNYTPSQDKATPSLIGDVARGVMLDRRPIFLGGQGGLVGPCVISFGTVTAAGSICRKDDLKGGRLIATGTKRDIDIPYFPAAFSNVKRIFNNNILYLANLIALSHWYSHVRAEFVSPGFPAELLTGLKETLSVAVDERVKRLKAFFVNLREANGGKGPGSPGAAGFAARVTVRWSDLDHFFGVQKNGDFFPELREPFLEIVRRRIEESGKDYIPAIKGLAPRSRETGSHWLSTLVSRVAEGAAEIVS